MVIAVHQTPVSVLWDGRVTSVMCLCFCPVASMETVASHSSALVRKDGLGCSAINQSAKRDVSMEHVVFLGNAIATLAGTVSSAKSVSAFLNVSLALVSGLWSASVMKAMRETFVTRPFAGLVATRILGSVHNPMSAGVCLDTKV